MKKQILNWLFLLLLIPAFNQLNAQVSTDMPIRWLNALPSTCSPIKKSEAVVFLKTNFKFYVCTSGNTWTALDNVQFNAQTGNTVFAAPNGVSGFPVFRSLSSTDIPGLSADKIISGILSTDRLGTGLPDSTKFLSGDGMWKITPVPGNYALEFDDTKVHHVNHGAMWQQNTDYGDFYFGIWLKPTGGQYFFSSGNGGAHLFLGGVTGDAVAGYTIAGNVWNANTGIASIYATTERIQHNVWSYVAVWGNGTRLGVSINGVPSFFTNWGGVRRVSDSYETIGYVGGSDHQHFKGRIAGWHLYEGVLPYSAPFQTVVRPPLEHFGLSSVRIGTTNIKVSTLADYRQGNTQDTGNGLNGSLHHGFLAETLSTGSSGLSDVFSFSPANNRVAGNRPIWVVDPVAITTNSPQKTIISGARIYDDYSGADISFATGAVLGTGTTRIGNKTWSNPNYGRQNGSAFAINTTPGANLITDNAIDCTIIFRKPAGVFFTGIGISYRVIFRYIDANNYNYLYIDEYGSGIVFTVVGGTTTNTGGFSIPVGWTEIKIGMAGSTITTYRDGTLVNTRTTTANASGTGKGYEFNHPLQRVSEFAVL